MKVTVGISNRHVHLTEEDFKILFGDKELTKRNDLSQKGQFAANEVVTIKGPRCEIEEVRILGPFRSYTQVEVAKTDAYHLGVNPPVRDSGNLEDAAMITIINGDKSIDRYACIVPTRHIHITQDEKEKYNLGDVCSVRIEGEKPAILSNVHVKVDPSYTFELHLDTDDGNGCLLSQHDEVEIINQ